MKWLSRIVVIALILTAFVELRVIQYQTHEMESIAREVDRLAVVAFHYGFVLSRSKPDLDAQEATAQFKENMQRISDKIDKGIK